MLSNTSPTSKDKSGPGRSSLSSLEISWDAVTIRTKSPRWKTVETTAAASALATDAASLCFSVDDAAADTLGLSIVFPSGAFAVVSLAFVSSFACSLASVSRRSLVSCIAVWNHLLFNPHSEVSIPMTPVGASRSSALCSEMKQTSVQNTTSITA